MAGPARPTEAGQHGIHLTAIRLALAGRVRWAAADPRGRGPRADRRGADADRVAAAPAPVAPPLGQVVSGVHVATHWPAWHVPAAPPTVVQVVPFGSGVT